MIIIASLCKLTKWVSGNLFDHYERKENIKFKNQDIKIPDEIIDITKIRVEKIQKNNNYELEL